MGHVSSNRNPQRLQGPPYSHLGNSAPPSSPAAGFSFDRPGCGEVTNSKAASCADGFALSPHTMQVWDKHFWGCRTVEVSVRPPNLLRPVSRARCDVCHVCAGEKIESP